VSAPDPGLLVRADALTAAPLGPGRFRVTGGREPHVVDLTGPSPLCDCGDHQHRGRACKHILAAARVPDDPQAALLDALSADAVLDLLGPRWAALSPAERWAYPRRPA